MLRDGDEVSLACRPDLGKTRRDGAGVGPWMGAPEW